MRHSLALVILVLTILSTFIPQLTFAKDKKDPLEEFFSDWVFAVCNSDHLERITHTRLLGDAYGADYGPDQLYAPELTIIERCSLKGGLGAVKTSDAKGPDYYARENRGVLYWCHNTKALQEFSYHQQGVWWPVKATHSLIVHYAKGKIEGSLRLFITKEGEAYKLVRPLPVKKKPPYLDLAAKYKKDVEEANKDLFLFAQQGKWPLLAKELKSGKNAHVRRSDGVGLLMIAAKKGATKFIVELLRLGFSATRKDDYGFNAIDYALQSKVKGLAYLLASSLHQLTVILMKDKSKGRIIHLRGRSSHYPLYVFGGKNKSLLTTIGSKNLDKMPSGIPSDGDYPKAFTQEFLAPEDLTYLSNGVPEIWISMDKNIPEYPSFVFRFADFSQKAFWKKKFPSATDEQLSAHLVNSCNTWRKFNELSIGMANAIGQGNMQAMQQGFNLGININEPIANGFITPLSAAANEGKIQLVDLLLRSHANPHQLIYAGSPICLAAAKNHHSVIERLVKLGVDLNEPNGKIKCTALHAALLVKKPNSKTLELLLSKGADPNRLATDGFFPPLVVAAAKGQEEAVRILMKHGAHVHSQNIMGITPMVAAAFMGRFNIVKLLVESGARVNDSQCGYSPTKLAKLRKFKKIEDFLIEHGAEKVEKSGYINDFWLEKLAIIAQTGN